MSTSTRRKLLLIACSNRKLRLKGLLPAIERYDGGTYRVIRKAQREGYFPPNVDIKILSAKFGLIDAHTPIPYYDLRMDAKRARELKSQAHEKLKRIIGEVTYSEVFINMGKAYLLAIAELDHIIGKDIRISRAEGGIGSKAKAMKEWLLVQNTTSG